MTSTLLETERLQLRQLTNDDAEFLIEVFTDPAFIRFVGDRNIRTVEQARDFLAKGPFESYRQNGFGHLVVTRKRDETRMGICGFVKRDALEAADIGFTLLPPFRAQGYAFEAASAVMAHGRDTLGFRRIVAIASPENEASIRLLGRLGLTFERMIQLSENGDSLSLFGWNHRE